MKTVYRRLPLMKPFCSLQYKFLKLDSQSEFLISVQGVQYEIKRQCIFRFVQESPYRSDKYAFAVQIVNTAVDYPDLPYLDLDKYLEKNHGIQSVKKLILDNYVGTFEQKLEQFIVFLENLFDEPILNEAIKGIGWNNDYHKHYWEGNNSK